MQRSNISNRAATAGRFWKHSEFISSFQICLRSLWLLKKTGTWSIARDHWDKSSLELESTSVASQWVLFQTKCILSQFKSTLHNITKHWFSFNSLPCLTAGVLFHLNKSGYSVAQIQAVPRLFTWQYPGRWPTFWYYYAFWRVRGGVVFFKHGSIKSKCAKNETFVWNL